jgi:hypothetical protein
MLENAMKNANANNARARSNPNANNARPSSRNAHFKVLDNFFT